MSFMSFQIRPLVAQHLEKMFWGLNVSPFVLRMHPRTDFFQAKQERMGLYIVYKFSLVAVDI